MLIGGTLLLAYATSLADTKIVSKITLTVKTIPTSDSAPTQTPVTQFVTTYYKGANARTDIDNGTITIYNRKEGKVYVLDPGQKTYFVQTEKEFLAPHPDPFSGQQNTNLKLSSDVTLTPGQDKRSIAGVDTSVVVLSGSVTVSAQRSGGGGGGIGGLGGFGGYGGGRRRGGGGGGSRSKPTKLDLSGEFWVSDALKLPDDKKATPLPSLFSAAPIENYVFGPLSDNLLKKKDLPLDSRIAVTSTSPEGDQKIVTRTTEVTAVTHEPLTDDLFALPVGYTQLSAPSNRG
jgi:hypothetical protein